VNTEDRWQIHGILEVSELARLQATPPAIGERIVPSPDECTVEPLTWQEIEAIAATQTAGSSTPRQTLAIDPALWRELSLRREAGLLQITGGDPADATTMAEVQHVLNTYFACMNAGDFARAIALYSEETVGIYGTLSGEDEASFRAVLEASPTPDVCEGGFAFYPVTSARILSTGHVVLLQPFDIQMVGSLDDECIAYDPDPAADLYLLVSFVKDGNRWRIDSFQSTEARKLLKQPSLFPPTPTREPKTPTPVQVVEIPAEGEEVITLVPTPTETMPTVTPATAEVFLVPSPTPVTTPTVALPAIGRVPIAVSVTVDAEGVLEGDPEAIAEAKAALQAALADLPAGCPVEFALTTGYAEGFAYGNALAEAINDLLKQEFSEFFSTTAFETIAVVGQPFGQVVLHLYVFEGCREEATVQPTRTSAFNSTHQSNSAQQINLRAGPGIDREIIRPLALAEPLQYLNEDAPTDDPARDGPRWMKFMTEDGQVGWVREIDVEPSTAPTPTPVG
jgi:hypothetical protein